MTRSQKNRRVVISDSESDLDDDSDELIDNANLTKQSSSPMGSNTKPSIDAVSEGSSDDNLGDAYSKSNDDNSSDDDLGDTSGESNEDMPSATANKREPSHRNPIIRSNDYTPSSFETPKTVKRKADMLDPCVSNRSNSSQNNDEPPERRRRPTRGKKVSYDMKHHPMDDILRPKYSAKRRANGLKILKGSSDHDTETDEDITNTSVGGSVIQSSLRRSSRKINQSVTPIYSGKWHPLDQMLRDNVTSASKRSKKGHKSSNTSLSTLKDEEGSKTVNADLESDQDIASPLDLEDETALIDPDIRRSARVSTSQKPPPNYDMKYHVMDSTLRPKATANRMKSKLDSAIPRKNLGKAASSAKVHTKQLATSSLKSSTERSVPSEPEPEGSGDPVAPAGSQLQNPYLNRTSFNWAELQDMDRCVYLLQKGAPLHGNTIPQEWNHVKKVLFHEDLVTLDELNSQEATKLLKTRYESVRLGLQSFFDSGPEPVDKEDWTLSKTERIDVYDTKPGKKYWKHQKDSVVEKTSNRAPALRVDIEPMTPVDRESNGELGSIIENENSLVENMRGEYPLSDAALEKLLLSDEQYLMEEHNRASEVFSTPRDKALDKASAVGSQANATDLDISNGGFAEPVPQDKEKVDGHLGHEAVIRKSSTKQIKGRKRKSRVDVPVVVYEDLPDSTPQIKKIVSMNHASPDTDIPKENFGDGDASIEGPSQIEMENPQTHRPHESVSTPSTRRVRRLESATNVTSPYRSLFGGPLGSSSPSSSPTTR